MKRLIQCLMISFIILSINSCSSDDDNGNSYNTTPMPSGSTNFSATLSGSSEVPSNASSATGSATLNFNNVSKIFTLTVTYSGVTATAAHVHKGAVGVSGSAIFPITVSASPMYLTSTALTAEQESDLMNNLYYVNIHSSTYPDGEIRGQLIKQTSGGGGGY